MAIPYSFIHPRSLVVGCQHVDGLAYLLFTTQITILHVISKYMYDTIEHYSTVGTVAAGSSCYTLRGLRGGIIGIL